MIFKRADLLSSSILAVEQSTYFATGQSPVHAEDDSEEIIYFRKGTGRVLLGTDYVDVSPGSAVPITKGIEHHVVNSGEDVLEHILISADISKAAPEISALLATGDYLLRRESSGLERLSCRKVVVDEGQTTSPISFPGRESVYAISSGFAVGHVGLPGGDYEWQYAFDSSHCFWLPPGLPHYFRNVGDCPLHMTNFLCVTGG
jgi:mannose-6-phosphate isomerase-like protein (cupin superfamily)